eukprot:9180105-Karenia_brevis.AAC.1
MATALMNALDCPGEEVTCASVAYLPPLRRFDVGDVAMGKDAGGAIFVGEIHGHACVLGICVTFISCWPSQGNDVFRQRYAPEMVATESLLDTCILRRTGDYAIVLEPIQA